MIAFSNHYNFPAENVDYIETLLDSDADFPYRLTVHTKSGKDLSVNYKNVETRDAAKAKLVREIERENERRKP